MDDEARPQLDGVLVVGLAACAGGLGCAAPVETALAAALLLVALARRGAPVVALLGALAFLIGAARTQATVGSYERDRDRIVAARAWPARCAVWW